MVSLLLSTHKLPNYRHAERTNSKSRDAFGGEGLFSARNSRAGAPAEYLVANVIN